MTKGWLPPLRGLRSAPRPSQRNRGVHCTAGDHRTDACWKYKLASDVRANYCCYGAPFVGKDPATPSANNLRRGFICPSNGFSISHCNCSGLNVKGEALNLLPSCGVFTVKIASNCLCPIRRGDPGAPTSGVCDCYLCRVCLN